VPTYAGEPPHCACRRNSCTLTGWPVRLDSMGGEDERDGLQVVPDIRLHRAVAVQPAYELLNQPRVRPFGLLEVLDLARLLVRPLAACDALRVEDQRGLLTLRADVLLPPAVQPRRVRLRALVRGARPVPHVHDDQPLAVARELAPRRAPGLRVDRVAQPPGHVRDQVQVVHRALDHQRVGYLVAEPAPRTKAPAFAGEPAHEVVERPVLPGLHVMPERGDVLPKAMAHRHAHLLPGGLHLLGDAAGGLKRVRDGLLAEDVQVVRQRRIDDRLVVRRGHDNRAEVRLMRIEGLLQVGVAALRREAQVLLRVLQRLGVDVHRGNRVDQPLPDVRRQECRAPRRPKPAAPNLDHLVCHREASQVLVARAARA